jgi:hypothetical protein
MILPVAGLLIALSLSGSAQAEPPPALDFQATLSAVAAVVAAAGGTGDPAALSRAMPDLARAALASPWEMEGGRRRSLDDRFRLQIVVGDYAKAREALAELRRLGERDGSPQAGATRLLIEIYAAAKER